MQSCCFQHGTLLLSPVISTVGCCFCFGSISSFFLELFLCLPPVEYWAPTDLGSSSVSVLSFCLFILFVRFSGEGNGTPLQHSCLENPMDGGAWWAAVYGVAQSWIRLKRLSSSSSNGVLKARILKWFAIPSSSGPHSVRPLHHNLSILSAPHSMA